ncbi:MAG: hypothetical protein AB3N34_00430 [Lettuce witches'-broom phytoplasma]
MPNDHKELNNNKEFEELEDNKEQETLSNHQQPFKKQEESNTESRTKREETPKSKIKITQAKYDKIASYILSENEDAVLTLNNLKPEEITVIEKARASHKQTLEFRKKDKERINKEQEKCDNLTNQRDSVINQILPLQKELNQKEATLTDKEKVIDAKKAEDKTTTNNGDVFF